MFTLAERQGGRALFKDTFNKVKAKLGDYTNRVFLDPGHVFSDTGFTTETLDSAIADPELADTIFSHAPPCEFIICLRDQMVVNINHSEVVGKIGSVTITVNTWPLNISPDLAQALCRYLGTYLDVNVIAICKHPSELSHNEIQNFEEFYVYHAAEFTRNKAVQLAFQDQSFADKRLFMVGLVDKMYNPSLTLSQIAHHLRGMELQLQLVCDKYAHIPSRLFSPATTPFQDTEDDDVEHEGSVNG
jgi:hypothetical protein